MTTFKVLSVKEYNFRRKIDWHRAMDKWEIGKAGCPNLAMYIYTNIKTGMERKTGYVRYAHNQSQLFKTKKEALKEATNDIY